MAPQILRWRRVTRGRSSPWIRWWWPRCPKKIREAHGVVIVSRGMVAMAAISAHTGPAVIPWLSPGVMGASRHIAGSACPATDHRRHKIGRRTVVANQGRQDRHGGVKAEDRQQPAPAHWQPGGHPSEEPADLEQLSTRATTRQTLLADDCGLRPDCVVVGHDDPLMGNS